MGLIPNWAGLLGSDCPLLGVSVASLLDGSEVNWLVSERDERLLSNSCEGLWNGFATNSPARGLISASSASRLRGSELEIWSCIFCSWMHCVKFGAENLDRRRAFPLGGGAREIDGPWMSESFRTDR